MKKFKDLSIRNKLFFSFFIVILFIFCIGVRGIINTEIINSDYSSLINAAEKRIIIINEIREKFTDARRASESMIVYKSVLKKDFDYALQYGFISEDIDEITKKTEEYKNTFNEDSQTDTETKENQLSMLNKINENLAQFSSATNNLNSAVLNKNNDKITEEANNLTVKAGLISAQLDYLNILDEQTAENVLDKNEAASNTSAIITSIVILIVIVLSVLFAIITSKSIVVPLKILTENTARIAKGDFTAQIGLNRADEVGLVSKSILQIKDTVKDLIKNINILSDEFAKGNMKSEIPANNYEGSYRETAEGINNIISTINNDFVTVSNCIKSYSDGNFKTICPDMPGDKKECKESLDILMNNILNVNNEINNISYSIASGNFGNKANTSLFKGGWKNLVENINILVEKVSLPIEDVSEALQKLASGNMNVSVKNTYEGKFKQMTENINHTSKTLHSYIDEISFVLENMANQNFDISIENEYYGDFSKIKDALNLIISNLNKLIKEIYSSSEQVNVGAKQIANTGVDLANGSSKQTEAVQRLNKAVNLVAEQVKKNSENAVTANKLAVDATKSVEESNKEITFMLKAMEEMYEASENISKIIKTIDDIAFQTNILALNAAVEAARAGEHGKGFAVVASEVRSLAGRSQKSAQETATLINTSNEKVQKGMETAEETAKVLKTMSAKIEEISSIISKVSEASEKQNGSIEAIVNDVSQIEAVVKNNSTVSEESAAASEELAGQSEIFKEMISSFKFKNV